MIVSRFIDPLLLFSALFLGVYLVATADVPTQSEFLARANNVLPAFSPEDITEVRWSHPHEFSLERNTESPDTSDFFVGDGGNLRADNETVRSVLRLLDLASFERTLGSGAHTDLHKLGFDEPRVDLSVLAGPRSYRIVAGSKAPSPPGSVYLKVEGTNVDTRVGVVDESLVSELEKSEQEFLGGLVFPLARSETAELSILRENETVRLIPDEDAFFLGAATPPRILADRQLVDLIFFQLARTKIETYLDEAPAAATSVTVEQKGQEDVSYSAKFGAPCPGDPLSIVVHRTEPTEAIGCTSRSVLAAYLITEEELRSKTATEMNPDEIDHATLAYDDRTLDLIRDGHGYELLGEDRKPVSQEAGDEFLKALATSKHTLLEAKPEAASPVGRVTLKGQLRNTLLSREKDRTDHIYEAHLEVFGSERGLFLHRLTDDAWLEVSKEDQWPYLAHQSWAQDRKLTSFGPSDIERVTVTLPSGTSWTVKRHDTGFLLAGPPEKTADPSLSRELFDRIAGLEALRFITPPQPRPEAQLLHLNFDIESSAKLKTHDLWVGERVRGGYRAWSDLSSGTFVLPYGVRSLLERPLVDRRPLRIDLDEQQRIEIETEGRSFVFEREGGVLHARDGEATDEMIEPLSQALSALRVVSAAGAHPVAKSIHRGPTEIAIRTIARGPDGEASELRIGQATVWQGLSCRTAWLVGDDETFFVEQASMEELYGLL